MKISELIQETPEMTEEKLLKIILCMEYLLKKLLKKIEIYLISV